MVSKKTTLPLLKVLRKDIDKQVKEIYYINNIIYLFLEEKIWKKKQKAGF